MRRFFTFSHLLPLLIWITALMSQAVAVSAQQGSAFGDRDEVRAMVTVRVSWNQHDEYGGNLEDSGAMSSVISGVLVKARGRSGVFLFVPDDSGMSASVQYQNIRSDKKTGKTYMREEGSGNVPVVAPQAMGDPKSNGHLELMALTGPGGTAHALQMGGEVDPFTMMQMMQSGQNMDHYSFSVAIPIKTIVTDEEGKTYEGLRGIHFALIAEALKGGSIGNSVKWTSDKLKYSIGYQSFMETKYEPPRSGDVQYSVTWNFGDIPPSAEIEREMNGKWVNITDETVKVVVGEKIKLRGVIRPEDQDPGKGSWNLGGGGSGRNYIKRYEADMRKGEVIDLENLNTREVEFYWVDGGAAAVEYASQAGTEEVSAGAKFEIKEPDYKVTIKASGESEVRNPERGIALDQKECMGTGAHGAANTDDLWLQYKGITFEAELLNRKEVSGSEQWVQIIEQQSYYQTFEGGVRSENLITEALDICYPTWKGPRGGDAPGILLMRDDKLLTDKLSDGTTANMVYTGKTQENRLYLMFRPDGDDSEWVPVKLIEWAWTGNAESQSWARDNKEPGWTQGWRPIDCQVIPKDPEAVDTTEYPEWDKNAGDEKQYSSKSPD